MTGSSCSIDATRSVKEAMGLTLWERNVESGESGGKVTDQTKGPERLCLPNAKMVWSKTKVLGVLMSQIKAMNCIGASTCLNARQTCLMSAV